MGFRGWGVTPRNFSKSIFNLVHSDAFFSFSGQFRLFLAFPGQLQDINEISGIPGISKQLGPLLTTYYIGNKRKIDKQCTYSVQS
jgi:hypothetical protein